MDMEAASLISGNEKERRRPRGWWALLFFLVSTIIGLVVAIAVVATKNSKAYISDSELCGFQVELTSLKNETHGMFRENRDRAISLFVSSNSSDLIYLRGNSDVERNGDVTYLFRQESNFIYLTGFESEDAHLVIHPATKYSVLFVPRRNTDYAIWNGVVFSLDQIQQQYDIDEVMFADQLGDYLAAQEVAKVHTLPGADFPFASNYSVNTTYLSTVMMLARRVKSEKELRVLSFVNSVSSHAHEYTMRKCAMNLRRHHDVWEYELESYFLQSTYNCKSRLQAYTSIVAAGTHGAILHYIANDAQVREGDLVLLDAGAELWGYGSDITRTFPANGKFTQKQKAIYNMVLKAQVETALAVKAGITWFDLNNITRTVITNELNAAGLINGTFADLWRNSIYRFFLPHGVGHSLGLDVHDEDFARGIERGAFITIEPGIYFNKILLDTARNNSAITNFFVWDEIDQYLDLGGVRIEDDYLVTQDGHQKITSITSSISDLEKLLRKDI